MSTRSIIIFKNQHDETHTYVHSDGYPSNRLPELQRFLEWNKPRNGDVSYSTANFIFWYKLDTIREFNEMYSDPAISISPNDESKQIKTLEDMLRPRENDDYIHRGIGVANTTFDDHVYIYVVDFDKKTIRIHSYETDITVDFGQEVEFDADDNIIIPA